MSSDENQFSESLAINIVRWVCFAGMILVVAFGILFGSYATIQPKNSGNATEKRKNSRSGVNDPKLRAIRELTQQAEQAFDDRNWEESARLYSSLVEKKPKNFDALYRLGWSLQSLDKLDEALKAYQAAKGSYRTRNNSFYYMAVIHAIKKDKAQTLAHLKQAINGGFIPDVLLSEEKQFAFLKDDAEFKLLERLAIPLKQRSIYRQFDFILGTWKLYNKSDNPLETYQTVKTENNGYLLTVVHSGGRGGPTMGFNYVDPEDLKWKQIWILDGGGVLKYEGEFQDGKMQFTGKSIDEKGNVILLRKIYTPINNDKVKHLNKNSKDGGKTWKISFDGYWVRDADKPVEQKINGKQKSG